MTPNGFYVYAYYEPGAAQPLYIGKGHGDRAWDHLHECRYPKTIFHKKLKSLLDMGIHPDIQILEDELTEAEANDREVRLITFHGRKDLGLGPLYNCTDGGDGVVGHRHDEKSLAKIRFARNTKWKMSDVAKTKMRCIMQGNTYAKGIKHTKEMKEAKSLRQMGKTSSRRKPVRGVSLTGEPDLFFESGLAAAKGGFNISALLKNSKQGYGYYWEYA